ncbi:MAG: hypothetical protein FWG10_05720 [Eubacteriaceae bacterium]|nr:hypothetical protein [Eubacteriaceae bacterium]
MLEIAQEPIFKDFFYGYCPKRNCHQAVKKVIAKVWFLGHDEVPRRGE